MPNENDRMFEAIRKFKQLNIIERLSLIPQSELVLMKVVLSVSQHGGRSSVSEIAKRMQVSPPAISRTLKRLREKQYVESITDESDRRNSYIVVTELGKNALEESIQKVSEFTQNVLNKLEPGELDQFYFLYNKIYLSMSEELDRICGNPEPRESRN